MDKKRSPPKLARFLIWCVAGKDNREDILVTFDEMFDQAVDKFGMSYAYAFAWQQAIRSFPYSAATVTLKIVGFFTKIGS